MVDTTKNVSVNITGKDSASGEINKVTREIKDLNSTSKKAAREGLQSISQQLAETKRQFLTFFIGLPSFQAVVSGFTRLAETAKEVDARLKLAAESQQELTRSQQAAARIALTTGQSYESIAGLYSKLRVNAGLAADESERLTDIIAKVTQFDGGGAGVQAAIFQLQQGLAAGALRGEELNSVLEQTPSLAKAIADGLGISVGQLRKVAEQGGLTAEVVRDSLFKMSSQINEDFSKLPLTTTRAFQNVRTQAILVLGKIDERLGITERFSKAIQLIADNIQTVLGLTSGAAIALLGVFAGASKSGLGLGSVIAGLGVVFKSFLTPLGAVGLILGTLTALFITNIDKTVEFSGKTTTLGSVVSATWRLIMDTISGALRSIQSILGVTGDDISNTLSAAARTASSLFKNLIELVNSLVSSVFSGFRLIGRSAGVTAASIVEQFKNAVITVRSLFSALAGDITALFSAGELNFSATGEAISRGLGEARKEATNLKNELVDAVNEENKFLNNGGVLANITQGIKDRLQEFKAVEDEFRKRNAVAANSPATTQSKSSLAAALKAEQDIAKARQDLENSLFQQAKRLADDQTTREIESTRQLFELKAISATEYYQTLNRLQTELAQREIAELERQKAVRQAVIDNPKSNEADRLKALADITELSASAAIVERELATTRATLINEVTSLEAKRLITQQEFIKELEREAFLSGLSNEERERAVTIMEAQKAGIQDINKVLQIQDRILANEAEKRRVDEVLRQQNQIFESVTRGVQQSFADGLYRVAKGEGGINEILSAIGDSILRAISNSVAGSLTDLFFNTFRDGRTGAAAPGGGIFSSLIDSFKGLFDSLKNGISGLVSSVRGLFGGRAGGFSRLFGFAEGGFTGSGGKYQPAGIVHAGEYVFSADSVRKIGINALHNLHQLSRGFSSSLRPNVGYAEGGLVTSVSRGAKQSVSNVVLQVNPDALNFTMRDWLESELARIAVGVR